MDILFQNYLTRGFWGDEAWTALISGLPIPEIIRVTGQDFHPPAYYLLVHGFIKLFGASEWIRLISVIFALLTPLAVYGLVKQWMSKRTAGVVAGVVALSPILLTYAFEARAYALLACLSVVSAWAFWRRKWLVYFLVAGVGVYTHYYMWFILASQGLYWLIWDRQDWKKMLGVFGGIGLVQLPWIPTLLSQVAALAKDYWIAPIDSKTHWEWLVRVTGGDFATVQRPAAVWLVLGLVGLSAITVRWREKKYPKAYWFLWLWLGIPVIVPTVISLYRPVFFYRYLIFSAIPILALAMWGVAALHQKLVYPVGGIIMAVYVTINLAGLARYPDTMREEIDKIWAEQHTDKLVTVLPAFAEVMYYGQDKAPVQVLPVGIVQFSGKSLLDAYVRQGRVRIEEPGKNESYWLIEPGPKATYYQGQ